LQSDNVHPAASTHRERLRAIFWSLLFGALLLAVKFAAYALTGSNAVLSDAFESIVNVAAAGFALYTIWIATHPADASHPYGHGKAEAFSAGFEGGLILLAGAAILWGAVPALWVPTPLEHLDAGLLLMAGAGGVNLVLGRILVRTGRQTGSVALEADGQHLLSDSVTTAGVLIGLGIVRFTGWLWVDPIVAIVVALHLLRVGAGLVRQAIANLMDQADPAILESIASALAGARRPGWVEVHNLRSWRTGDFHHVDCHLTLPRFWDLEQAHQAGDGVAAAVQVGLDGPADVIVHLDPCVPDCCSYCDYEPCPARATDFNELADWSASSVVGAAEYERGRAWGRPTRLRGRPPPT
jgi:cation diffusion facilitator family transporter